MKTRFLMLLAAVLLCVNAFAQSGSSEPKKGDVNDDGTVDVADIVAVIGIIKNGQEPVEGLFYLGTTQPTAENYQSLPGVVATYTSFDQAVGATATVAAGETIYMLCPAKWMEGKSAALEDKDGNTVDFLEDKDATTISGYVIYKTQAWNGANSVTLKATTTYYWYAGLTLPTAANIASIALGSSTAVEHWSGKSFLITNNGSTATPVYVCTPTDFNVTWKDPNGFDINLPEVTDARFTYNGVTYKVQKKGRDLSAGAEFAVNGYCLVTYYWYAGTTLPSAENLASIAVGSSNSIEQWNGKVFNITNSGSTSTPAYVCTPVDYKVSWKDMNGFTINLVEVEGARFTLNGINYIVQKRGRDLISGATLTVKGYYTN